MKYKKFLSEVAGFPPTPAPDIWASIEQSISRPTIIAFPRLRVMLIAAAFAVVCVLPTTLLVANHDRQEMYAYLQNTGSSEYVALASINY